MSKDISTQFTKERNKRCGRRGGTFWKEKKETIISPKDYGMFKNRRKGSN